MEKEEIKRLLTLYTENFLEYYKKTIDRDYSQILAERNKGLLHLSILPLYDRKLGGDVALSACITERFSYIYFIFKAGVPFENIIWAEDIEEFKTEPFIYQTYLQQEARVKEFLKVGAKFNSPYIGRIFFPGRLFTQAESTIVKTAKDGGSSDAHSQARVAEKQLAQLQELSTEIGTKIGFKNEYSDLKGLRKDSINENQRGVAFEKLVRSTFDFYGWKIKEVKKKGEQIDFTGIFEGNHIIGEVRWKAKPIESKEIRDFIGKLNPRPQSIGLFISCSGYTDDVKEVLTQNQDKIVITFDSNDIEEIFIKETNPGDIFSKKLRDRYDLIFSY